MTAELTIPEIVRRRAANLGAEGIAWLAGLDATIAGLLREWDITLGRVLAGGSEAFVAEVTLADGTEAILKVGLPGSGCGEAEARVFLAAEGRTGENRSAGAYAQLYRHDAARRAMLLERLGPRLDELGLTANEEIGIICAMLQVAWCPVPPGEPFMTGREKADDLAVFIAGLWEELERPCSERVVERALEYARRRAAAFAPERTVLAHGDAHASNTLLVPGSEPRQFKFIDPDGLSIEPAYDLGILMRGWGAPLLAGDALALGRERARWLSELTGVEVEPIWEWGFMERVSTGLLLQQLGHEAAAEYLAVAEAWAVG